MCSFDDELEAALAIVIDVLRGEHVSNLDKYVVSGDWVIFLNVSSRHYVNVLEYWRYNGEVRLRIAVNLRRSWDNIQERRSKGLDEFNSPVRPEMVDGEGMRAPYHFYSYTLMEAVAQLNIRLDDYILYKMPLEELKGFDLVVPDDNSSKVYGQYSGFDFVDGLLRGNR